MKRLHLHSAALLLTAPLLHAQTYQITGIGLLDGAPTCATAINDDGIVCGYALPDASTAKAWVFEDSTLTELTGLGGADTRAMTVAADGRVYGYATDGAGLAHAVRWENGVITDLGPASGTDAWFAQGVNASGDIAGHTGTAAAPGSAFSLSLSSFTALPPLAGATAPATNAAYDINDAGAVVGVSSWVGGGTRAFRTDGSGAPVSLGTLGANDSTAMSINTAGDVAGYSVNAGNATRAFIFTDGGGLRDLGVLAGHVESRAFSINDAGLVAGTSEDAAGNARAFLWNGSGALLDLNPLIPPNSGFTLNEAQDINNGGDIVGCGTVGGVAQAYIIERFEGLDTLAPIVSGSVAVTNGAPASVVTVNFWDNEKVVGATTYATGMIRVTGPNGYDAVAAKQSWFSADRQASTSTFTFTPPGGSWNGADNGTYEILLAPGVVSDLAGNTHPGGVIGTFTVGIQTVPTLTLSGLPASTTPGTPVNLTVTATGSYPAAAGDVFAVAIDWDGDGGDLQTVNATSNTAIPHTFTALGTHTVRVTVTDPHALTSSGRTAQITVTNNPALPLLSSVRAEQTGYFGSMNNVRVAEKAGKFYLFGGLPLSNDNTPAVTWNYSTPGAAFTFEGDLDNGPIYPEGAALDGRGRICVWGGADTEGGTTANAMTYTTAGGVGGGIVDKPTANPGVSARDNPGRLYSISPTIAYRYDAGASGSGAWSTLAAPPNIPCGTASYDGAGRIIVFGGTTAWAYSIAGNAWSQLANSPAAVSSAAPGADGFIYLVGGTTVYAFNSATSTTSAAGRTNYDHTGLPAAPGNDGLIYYFGASYIAGTTNIETLDTNPALTRAPRITSVPTATTALSVGNAWTCQVAAGGKPAPSFSIVSGPAGLSVGASSGLVAWTPAPAQTGTHTARVRASNSAGIAEQMMTLTVPGAPPDTTPPAPPTNLAAFNITTTSADLQWSPGTDNTGVVSYRLKTARRSGTRWRRTTTYPTFGTTSGLTWHVTASVGAVVNYYIVSVDAAGNESTRALLTVAFIAPPSISANNGGTFYGTRAIVGEPWVGNTFTALGNPVPTLSAGTFPAGAVWHSTAANSGYYTWTAIAGQEGAQTFTVNATNTGGNASFSNNVTVYPAGTDLIPPGAVGSLVVDQISFDSCRATWTAATDNYGVAACRVSAAHREPRRRFHHGAYNDHVLTFEVPAGTSSVIIPGLRSSTSYIVSITARDTAGLWGSASTRDIRTLLQPFVLNDALLNRTVNPDGSTTLTWPGYGYYWNFIPECSADLANWLTIPAGTWPSNATSITFTSAQAATHQFFRVRAVPAAAP